MKPITIVQAAILVMLAVFGAYAGTKPPQDCVTLNASAECGR